MTRLVLALAMAVVAMMGVCAYDMASYVTAASYYESFVARRPLDRAEVESRISWAWAHSIEPEESSWGRGHQLEPGHYFRQYLVLGRAPIDVVFDPTGKVVTIYSSYE